MANTITTPQGDIIRVDTITAIRIYGTNGPEWAEIITQEGEYNCEWGDEDERDEAVEEYRQAMDGVVLIDMFGVNAAAKSIAGDVGRFLRDWGPEGTTVQGRVLTRLCKAIQGRS